MTAPLEKEENKINFNLSSIPAWEKKIFFYYFFCF